jgi:hypothetical protein
MWCSSRLKMETISFSKMLVSTYDSTWHHNPEHPLAFFVFQSVTPGKCWWCSFKQTITTSFPGLPNSKQSCYSRPYNLHNWGSIIPAMWQWKGIMVSATSYENIDKMSENVRRLTLKVSFWCLTEENEITMRNLSQHWVRCRYGSAPRCLRFLLVITHSRILNLRFFLL